PACRPSAGLSSVNTMQSCSRIMDCLQWIGSDQPRRVLSGIHLPDCSHAWSPSVRCGQFSINLITRTESRFSHSGYFILHAVLLEGNGQYVPIIQGEAKYR